jgi:hypothetical protein
VMKSRRFIELPSPKNSTFTTFMRDKPSCAAQQNQTFDF